MQSHLSRRARPTSVRTPPPALGPCQPPPTVWGLLPRPSGPEAALGGSSEPPEASADGAQPLSRTRGCPWPSGQTSSFPGGSSDRKPELCCPQCPPPPPLERRQAAASGLLAGTPSFKAVQRLELGRREARPRRRQAGAAALRAVTGPRTRLHRSFVRCSPSDSSCCPGTWAPHCRGKTVNKQGNSWILGTGKG